MPWSCGERLRMPAREKIREAHWDLLLERICSDRCVAFLGAGVNVAAGEYPGLPLGRDVALQLLQRLVGEPGLTFDEVVKAKFHDRLEEYQELKRFGVEDLARVALSFGFVNDKEGLIERLQKILPDKKRTPSAIAQGSA